MPKKVIAKYPIAYPTPPIMLIILFALLLNGFGVISGIRATHGDRYIFINTSTKNTLISSSQKLPESLAIGKNANAIALNTIPTAI